MDKEFYKKEREYIMMTGKLNWDVLQKLLKENQGAVREEVLNPGGIGEDCAVVSIGDEKLILTTDPVTAASVDIGHIAFHINVNDLATTGARPLGIMVTILAPSTSSLEEIQTIMMEISREAKKDNVMVIGGHTEVTDAVNRTIVSITAIGTMDRGDQVVYTSGAKVGDKILVTKALGLEGTSIIANDFEDETLKVLSYEEIEEAKDYAKELSVLKEGRLLRHIASSMHDITEGGLLGALWELKEASGKGFSVYEEKLPIRDLTLKICTHFNLEPLKLISSGSMLITVTDGEEAMAILHTNQVEAHIIGEVTREGSFLYSKDKKIHIDPPKRDEIYRLYDENLENN